MLVKHIMWVSAVFLQYQWLNAQENTYPPDLQQKIDRVADSMVYRGKTYLNSPRYSLREWMEKEGVPGVSIAVIKDYEVEWVKSWGLADVKEGTPMTPETLVSAGSIAKSINVFAFLKLQQAGKIDFQKDINEIMTEWQFPYTREQPINTYHLLSHTSGLWYHWVSTYDHGPFKPTLLKFLNRKKSPRDKSKPYLYTNRDPGLKYEYSNVGYSVSQQVLTEVTGMTFEAYVQQEVFGPLEMNNSLYTLDDKKHVFASGHWNGGKRVPGKYRPQVEFAPGGLWTTPEDLAKYVIALQRAYAGSSERVLDQEQVDYIFNPIKQQLAHNAIVNQGLGAFLVNKKGGAKYFFHDGLGIGHAGMFIGAVEGGYGAVVLMNGPSDGLVNAIIARIAEVYDWPDYLLDEVRTNGPLALSPEVLHPYTGKFRCVEHPENEVDVSLWEDQYLVTNFTGGEHAHPIYHPLQEPNAFWAESYDHYSFTKLTFSPDEDGKMNAFVLSNPDKTTHWKRIKEGVE